MKREETQIYKDRFPRLRDYYNEKYGIDNWKAFRSGNGQFSVEPIEKFDYKNVDVLIADTDRSGFVWLKLSSDQADICMISGLFDVYIRHDDESESLVENYQDYMELYEEGFEFYLEVGHVDPDFFGVEL